MLRLPIEEVLPEVRRALEAGRNVVLTAEPGAGKTTRVPLALRDAAWVASRKILMLEPRRLAARMAAHYMAHLLGESVGETVGYRIRLETKVGPRTRIEVVTEGILTRLLQRDPALTDYGLVIFDEFHERSLHADVGLALALDSQQVLRPDLRLLVMSATLQTAALPTLLGDAAVISCEGRQYPVATHFLDRPRSGSLEAAVVQTIRRALTSETGSLLVFLPGMGEIRRVERRLQESSLPPDVLVAPLHGELVQDQQEQAILPAPSGKRKVVLATSIAETSLTIEGVRVVIDAGLMRVPRFDPRSGLSRLETIRVSQDAAEQRRGRAGRVEPGVCYRLWTVAEHDALRKHRSPEMLEADLAPLALDLALWGATDAGALSWLDPPPAGALAQGRDLLKHLGALDGQGHTTAHGKRMADLALHPRLAHMILKAIPLGWGSLAHELAAVVSERDLLRGSAGRRNTDLRIRLEALHGSIEHVGDATVDRALCRRIQRAAESWRRHLHLNEAKVYDFDQVGVLLAFAYPDRIAQRQPGTERRYLLANGSGAIFPAIEPLSQESYVVIADLDAGHRWATIFLAAPITPADLETHCADQIDERETVTWDDHSRSVVSRRQRCLGAIVLADRGLAHPDPQAIKAALLHGLRQTGLSTLAWTKDLLQWRTRVAFLRQLEGPQSMWPDLSDEWLLAHLEHWLGPFLDGLSSLAQVRRMNLAVALEAQLSWEQRKDLDRLAPTHLTVPSGSRIRLDYDAGDAPVLAVRLQELFGCRETPRVAGGRVPVMLHLLSPAGRPVQITSDLASFWATAYHDVKKELRGRYPKHPWPDDPLSAPPTKRTKGRT